MNAMNLPDGPGWSPDGGKYWVKGDLLYWNDGHVWDMRDGGLIRTMPDGYKHDEDYSAWSDEKRASVVAESKRLADEALAEEKKEDAEQEALCRSAKAKLTEGEYDAVQRAGGWMDTGRFSWEDLA